ncbi:MAG: 2-C-methyl-D-erythritol 4-phosphate cytidylyltransferase [Candidatus Omnitrophota bacterium]
MRTVAIVAAAGYGKRLGLRTKKPFVRLRGKPLVAYALGALDACRAVDGIIVAAEKGCVGRMRQLVRRFGFRKVIEVTEGGRTRFESVRNCLEKAGPSYDVVLIQDGGRPFPKPGIIEKSIRAALKYGGAIVAVPESDTVKLVDNGFFVKKTLDRRVIFRAETPQAFRYGVIKRAYGKIKGGNVTDDAGLVERAGGRVKIIKGSPGNIKVTTREDLRLAEVLL